MIDDYCPGCGHLLSNDKVCSFCNYSYADEQLDHKLNETFGWEEEDYNLPNFTDD